MKKAWIGAVVMAGMAWAGQSVRTSARIVVVCAESGQDEITSEAQMIASKIFAEIGVRLQWHESARSCQAHSDQAILINYSHDTPKDRQPGALAYALPYEGVHIEVFYDRLIGNPSETVRAHILGHVLAHEITHILQGTAQHSDVGVMKAHWTREDLAQMQSRQLHFTERDVVMIGAGLNARSSRAMK